MEPLGLLVGLTLFILFVVLTIATIAALAAFVVAGAGIVASLLLLVTHRKAGCVIFPLSLGFAGFIFVVVFCTIIAAIWVVPTLSYLLAR